ncbi:MAG: hypothetical protein K2L14_05255 [Duncaniella sp.]|nr:hypothetical protein [Duncaniella sp.]
MSTIIIIITGIIALAAIAAAFMSRPWAPAASFIALVIAGSSEGADISSATIIFWMAAAIIVTIIVMTLPRTVARSTTGVAYIAGAALAGLFTGICISHAAIIIGTVIGAILGAIAYCRTPSGRALGFPGRKAVNYLCAKAFPIVITFCIAGELTAAITMSI